MSVRCSWVLIRDAGWERVVSYRAVTDNHELATNFRHIEMYVGCVLEEFVASSAMLHSSLRK